MAPHDGPTALLARAMERGWLSPEQVDRLLEVAAMGSIEERLVRDGLLSPERIAELRSHDALAGSICPICRVRPTDHPAPGEEAPPCESCREILDTSGAAAGPSGGAVLRLGRHVEAREIARGGMGAILGARDPALNRRVAIKTLTSRASRDQAGAARFLAEAQITGQLEHPNIVPVHELGRDEGGNLWFSMKLVQGSSLADALEELRRPAPRRLEPAELQRLLSVFLKVCDAVAFAHASGVVHRDLKPANVMLGEYGEVLVMDWGLSKIRNAVEPRVGVPVLDAREVAPDLGPFATRDGSVLGTVAYMPPEQAHGRLAAIDERSDVYSLGAILYEILTLSPPFRGTSFQVVLHLVAEGCLEAPSSRAPWAVVPRELEAVVLRAMAYDPVGRHPSVLDLQAEIERYLSGRTLQAARYTLAQRAAKWVGRHRALSGAAASVAVLGLVLAGLFRWQARRERLEEARSAVREADLAVGSIDEAAARLAVSSGRPAPDDADRRDAALDAYLGAATALERALSIDPGDPDTLSRRRQVGLELGRTALAGGDFTLARRAFLDLREFGEAAASVESLLAEVEAARTAELLRRADRLEAILADLREGLGRPGREPWAPRLEDLVHEASTFEDPQTIVILDRALAPILEKAAAAGSTWSEGEESVARFACRAFGRLGTSLPGAVDPLERVLGAAPDGWLAEEAGIALCATGQASAAPELFRARERLGDRSNTWSRIRPHLSRLPGAAARSPGASAADLVALASELSDQGDWAGAFERSSEALDLDPGLAEAWWTRGKALHLLDRMDEALSDLDRAVALDPVHPTYRLSRALVREAQGDLVGAREDLDRCLELDDGNVHGYRCRASLRHLSGDVPGAIQDLERAIDLDPGSIDTKVFQAGLLFWNGDPAPARRLIETLIEATPSPGADCFRMLVDLDLALGDAEAAMHSYSRSIEIDPRSSEAYAGRAQARVALGDAAGARADVDLAVARAPRNGYFLAQRAEVRLGAGDPEGAAEDARGALALEPRTWRAHAVLARVALLRRDWDRAEIEARKALEIDGTAAESWSALGESHRARGFLDEATADYERALATDPGHSPSLAGRASLSCARGEYDAAIADADRAIERNPRNTLAWAVRGIARQQKGDRARARSDLDRAIEIDPRIALAPANRAILRNEAGDFEGVRADCDRAIEIDPGIPEAWNSRGTARSALADKAGAEADFTRAIELSPATWSAFVNRSGVRIERRDAAGAAVDARRATEIDPANWMGWHNLGLALTLGGDREGGLEALARALETAPPANRATVEASIAWARKWK